MTQFQAGKTYPLRGGGQGEIFVTKDGRHWGRIIAKFSINNNMPTCWDEETGKNHMHSSYDIIAPPTTVTVYANFYKSDEFGPLGCLHKSADEATKWGLIMNETKNNGGPAFPQNVYGDDDTGMKLRDYFAAKALQGMLSSDSSVDRTKVNKSAWAKVAYQFANAMLKERRGE